ncbi:MAG: hypothetical protein R2702_18290 [Acidimicrobiales bacterium]
MYAPPPAPITGAPDPNGLGVAVGRLGSSARKGSKVAIAIASALLDDGEMVEAAVAGKVEGNGAVLVLTDRRALLVDDREWRPYVERLTVDGGLTVQGWQDDRSASLTFQFAGRQVVLDQIVDRPLAVEMAQRIRHRTGAAG